MKNEIPQMKKNSSENFRPLQVDPINGDYYVIIPEWIVNDLEWYEDTEIEFTIDGKEIILSEKKDD